jgi:hypothetical protein
MQRKIYEDMTSYRIEQNRVLRCSTIDTHTHIYIYIYIYIFIYVCVCLCVDKMTVDDIDEMSEDTHTQTHARTNIVLFFIMLYTYRQYIYTDSVYIQTVYIYRQYIYTHSIFIVYTKI